MSELKSHPAADVFPLMDEARLAELAANIEDRGLLVPIRVFDGMILDGRNRYAACMASNVEPRFEQWEGENPYEYVWSLNGERRDLTSNQRYLCWKLKEEKSETWLRKRKDLTREANRKRSEATASQPRTEDGQRVAPKEPGSGTSSATTRGHATRKAKAAASKVDRGTVERMDALSKKRPDLAERVRVGDLRGAEASRLMRRDSVSEKVAALPDGKFRVIYADPPWQYGNSGAIDDSDHYSRVEKHYPPMPLSDICALDVTGLSADDAVLFLWVTSPLIEYGLNVVKAWGFTYKSCFVWDKVRHNFGHYNSVRHEFLLIATRGSCTPDKSVLHDSVQSIEKSAKHSQKPREFRELVDDLYPHGPRIELFARGVLPNGWKAWGNEAAT